MATGVFGRGLIAPFAAFLLNPVGVLPFSIPFPGRRASRSALGCRILKPFGLLALPPSFALGLSSQTDNSLSPSIRVHSCSFAVPRETPSSRIQADQRK
jgi:hypothetical protein